MKCSKIDFIIDKTHPSPNYNERIFLSGSPLHGG